MIRTFRYPLLLTYAQESILSGWVESCRQLFNACLSERREAYRLCGKTLTYYDQQKELTELRAADAEYEAIPAWVLRSAIARLQRGFDRFFRRIRARQKPGYPRFRGRDRYDSFDLPGNVISVKGDRVKLPKLEPIKFHRYRDIKGEVKSVTIKRGVLRWYVSFACDVGAAPTKVPVPSAVGIDLGLTSFMVLSTGETINNPRFFRAGEELLARRQRRLAKKKRGSKSRMRVKRLVGKAYEHIKNQRVDFARKLACDLFRRFDLVAHEDLNIHSMVHGNLAKSIHDAAWGMAVNALASKAECAGKWAVPVNPRRSSQECNKCGAIVQKELSERSHVCACGEKTTRDHNSSLVILARGRRAVEVMAEVHE